MVGDFPDEMRALTNVEELQFGKMLYCFVHIVCCPFYFPNVTACLCSLAYNRYLSGTIPSFLTALTKLIALTIGASIISIFPFLKGAALSNTSRYFCNACESILFIRGHWPHRIYTIRTVDLDTTNQC